MSLWIRIDANIGDNPNVWKLAELRGVSAEACVGLLVILFGRVAENRPSGDVSDVPDALLERWAGWTGEPGAFARDFRTLFVSDGVIDGWHKRQGKLLERAEKERERWHRRNSTESDAKLRGASAEESAVRDETLRNKKNKQKKPSATGPTTYTPEFEALWESWPSEYRGSKRPAFRQWEARLDEGHTAEIMQAGAGRYVAYCTALGRTLKNASTFIGQDLHFLEPWAIPANVVKLPAREDRAGLWLTVCREFDLFSFTGNGEDYRAKVERAKASGKIGPAFDAELKLVRPWEKLGSTPEQFVEREIASRLGRVAA